MYLVPYKTKLELKLMLTLPGFTVLNPARFAVAAKQLRRNIKKKEMINFHRNSACNTISM